MYYDSQPAPKNQEESETSGINWRDTLPDLPAEKPPDIYSSAFWTTSCTCYFREGGEIKWNRQCPFHGIKKRLSIGNHWNKIRPRHHPKEKIITLKCDCMTTTEERRLLKKCLLRAIKEKMKGEWWYCWVWHYSKITKTTHIHIFISSKTPIGEEWLRQTFQHIKLNTLCCLPSLRDVWCKIPKGTADGYIVYMATGKRHGKPYPKHPPWGDLDGRVFARTRKNNSKTGKK